MYLARKYLFLEKYLYIYRNKDLDGGKSLKVLTMVIFGEVGLWVIFLVLFLVICIMYFFSVITTNYTNIIWCNFKM